MLLGGIAIAMFIIGVVFAGIGFKLSPPSWSLMLTGICICTLTYFVVGSAVAGASSEIAGQENVARAAPRTVPWAVGLGLLGLTGFSLRTGLRVFSGEGVFAKLGGIVLWLAGLGAGFVGVQVIRGGLETLPGDNQAAPTSQEIRQSLPPERPIMRRGVGRH